MLAAVLFEIGVLMEMKSELIYISNVRKPLQNFLSYITQEDTYSDVGVRLLCAVLLLFSLSLFVRLITKWYIALRVEIAHSRLYKAASKDDVLTCMRIVEKYPSLINVPSSDSGYSPFMVACLNGHTQIVKHMISAGADVHQKSRQAESPFYLAIYNHIKNPSVKDASCIHALYYAGADVNETNGKGYSPLQAASAFGHSGLVKWLLAKGAKSDCIPSPYVLARMQGHLDTAAHFKKNNAL